jgi:vancomycin resistance protein YoaR
MGEAQGFKKALGFDSNGRKIKVFGGGMCQISSTIYNTALNLNLEILERHPHSRRVYYVPKDKDATVYYDTLDLKFKNNTNYDIKIIATSDNSNVTIKFMKITNT